MDFELGSEEVLLQDTVGRLLASEYPFEKRREALAGAGGYSERLWDRWSELGLFGLAMPDRLGGLDASPASLMVCMHEFGRALVVDPFIESVVLAGSIVRSMAPSILQDRLAHGIVSGNLIIAVADGEARDTVAISSRPDSWRLSGKKRHVVWAGAADHLIVSAQAGPEVALFLLDSRAEGVRGHPFQRHDGRHASNLEFANANCTRLNFEGADAAQVLERALDEANAAMCSEAVGAMHEAVTLTARYLETRRQFGVAIGTFQALRHKVADMQVALEHSRSMAVLAMLRCRDENLTRRRRAVSSAKVQISRAGRTIGQAAIQLHGAIGMTDECAVGHFLKRLESIAKSHGDEFNHIERLAACGGALD